MKCLTLGAGLLLFFLVQACDPEPEEKEVDENTLVAKLAGETLTKAEFARRFQEAQGMDSLETAKKIIENWAADEALYQEAVLKLGEDQEQLAKQVEAYKRTLVVHLYLSKVVEANLDTTISEDEIREYYSVHRDNFVLKDNIAKVDYIKVPVQAKDLEKIKKLIRSSLPKDKNTLVELCSRNAESFLLNDSTWLYTSDIRREIPKLSEEPDFTLYTGKVVNFEDESYYYYMRIRDVKIKNGLSPLNFEREHIKQYILLNRKTLLLNEYRKNLLEEAKAGKKLKLIAP